jgi:hypothetical protein
MRMRKTLLIGVPFAAILGLSSACSEDLGSCDEEEARRLIINGEGQVLYAGQAIINQACAAGQCHASDATGELRQGAPKSLDFDLNPAGSATGDEDSVESGDLVLNAKAIARLRKNQRAVFDNRELIWTQIVDGLMPPDGVGQPFRDKAPGAEADITKPCEKKEALGSVTSSQSRSILRNWLACGSPVVEAADEEVSESVLTMQPAGLPGTVGQQMPLCISMEDCSKPITFDELYETVIVTSCVTGCHSPSGAYALFDLDGIDTAYESLIKDNGTNCMDQPTVVPGNAAGSYIVTKMGGESDLTLCGGTMPAFLPVLECGVLQMAAWINAGAPKPGEPAAGASDAGM